MPRYSKSVPRFCVILFMLAGLVGCMDDDEESGSTAAGDTAPASFIGKKMVQEITGNDGRETTIGLGSTITYQFIDATTVLGEGDNVVPTTAWSYEKTGSNTARVRLEYHNGASYTNEYLTFNSDTRGIFETEGMAGSTPGEYNGTFVISDVSGGGTDDGFGDDGSGGDGGDDDVRACETNNTGTLTFWVSYSGMQGSVNLNVSGLGSRSTSNYFSGSGPECGSTQVGAMTFNDVPATNYDYSASDSGGVSWSSSVPVDPCVCSRVELF